MKYFHRVDSLKTRKEKISFDISAGCKSQGAMKKNGVVSSKNLGTRDFPAVRIREAFGLKHLGASLSYGSGSINGVFYYSNGTHFVYGGAEKFEIGEGRKQFENFNGRVLIFPDRMFYDPSTDTYGTMDCSTGVITYKIIKRNVGEESWGLSVIATFDHPVNELFKVGDRVFIDGHKDLGIHGFHTIIQVAQEFLIFDREEFGSGDPFEVTGELTRGGPKACDAACVSGGRVWVATNGRIYASILNDERNWELGSDAENTSYMCDMDGSDKITFCCEYEGSPVFFTERGIYRMHGDRVSNFSLRCASGHGGIEERFRDSAKRVGDKIFYMTSSGVACFDGNTSTLMTSAPIGAGVTAAVGGGDDERYFLSITQNGESKLYVYDTVSEIWQCWGDYFFNDIFMTDVGLCGTLGEAIYLILPRDGRPNDFNFERAMVAELVLGNTDLSDGARPVRMLLSGNFPDVKLGFAAVYDGVEYDVTESAVQVGDHIEIPLLPRRCDSFCFTARGGGTFAVEKAVLEVVYG